jgi:hypothetical protein
VALRRRTAARAAGLKRPAAKLLMRRLAIAWIEKPRRSAGTFSNLLVFDFSRLSCQPISNGTAIAAAVALGGRLATSLMRRPVGDRSAGMHGSIY